MKKFFAALLTAITVALLAVCLSACGGGADYVGTYKFYSMSMSGGGLNMEYKVGETATGGIEVTEDYIVLEVKEDSTFVMSGTVYGDSSQSGTWKDDGGKLSLTIGGGSMVADSETITGTLKGDKLTISQSEEGYQSTIVLVKQKSSSNLDNGDNEDEEVSLLGTYKFYLMTIVKDGQTLTTMKVGDEGVTEDDFVMEIKEDGTLSLTSYGHTMSGTWVANNNDVSITIQGDTQHATFDGGKTLTLSGEDQGEITTVVLVKSKTSSGNDGSGSTGGSTGSLAQYAGTYKFYSMTMDGYTVGSDIMTEDFVVLVLNADGTGTYSVSSGGESAATPITWTASSFDCSGQHVTFTFEGDTVTFTLSSGSAEVTYTLKKK